MIDIQAATARRADVAKASEAKAAAEKAAKAEFEAALAAKAAAEEARKAEMMAGISAGYDKEAAAIRIAFENLNIQKKSEILTFFDDLRKPKWILNALQT